MGNGESTNQNNFQSRNNKGRPQIKTTPIPEVNNIEEEDYHKGIQQYLWKIIVVGDISTGKVHFFIFFHIFYIILCISTHLKHIS